jgi:hypothetical protein
LKREAIARQFTNGVLQLVEDHRQEVSIYAGMSAEKAGIGQHGRIADLVHDAGKFAKKFQDYLHKALRGEAHRRGEVSHAPAGAQ